jgi:hypothetical protein
MERKAQLLACKRQRPPFDEVDRFMMVGVGPEPMVSETWKGTNLRAFNGSTDSMACPPSRKLLPSHAGIMGSLASTHRLLHSNCFGGGRIVSPTRSPNALNREQPWVLQGFLGGQSLKPIPSREHFHRPSIFGEEIEASCRMNIPLFRHAMLKQA